MKINFLLNILSADKIWRWKWDVWGPKITLSWFSIHRHEAEFKLCSDTTSLFYELHHLDGAAL